LEVEETFESCMIRDGCCCCNYWGVIELHRGAELMDSSNGNWTDDDEMWKKKS
jgi:hypothetical protein